MRGMNGQEFGLDQRYECHEMDMWIKLSRVFASASADAKILTIPQYASPSPASVGTQAAKCGDSETQ